MIRRFCTLLLSVVFIGLPTSRAQTSPPPVPVKADHSKEAAIIEEMSTEIVFDNDGTSICTLTSRVRVQTDGGVQHWGLLNFPFQSATQVVEIDYVRVRKPDGTILITPPDNVQDLDAEITRSAPFYSDLREKHVAVKSLGKGDVLEYQAHWRSTKSLIPGQFWYQYNFQHESVVFAERLEIKVPAGRAVKVKGPQDTQTVRSEPGFQVYAWTFSKLQSATDPGSDTKRQTQTALGRLPPPDVQISSFQSWDEVGRWYWNLQKDRIEPTSPIRAKAAELTKGLTDDAAKMRALYNFVSLQYRYIGIAFGIGRYQPHAADDVLTNNYGDCKDKHTLLASLLQASGITLYPALIGSSRKLDPDVPSPAQFDHIIGYLPPARNDAGKDAPPELAIWLDTTPEVAPFGILLVPLRDKQALVMSADKPAQLITTPADPASPGSVLFKISGKLSDNGSFDAKVEDTMRGDREIPLRSAFRQVPQSQWKDLVQGISQALGYSGTVSEVSASTPEMTTEPFHFSYTYNRKEYPDWSSDHRFTVPGLPFYMPVFKEDAIDPLYLGPYEEIVSDSKLEVPKGYTLHLPANVDLKYDFAEYHANYSQDHGSLTARRRLLIKLHEVPLAESSDYRSFVKKLHDDVYRYVQTSSGSTAVTSPAGKGAEMRAAIDSLPASKLEEVNQLEQDALASMRTYDVTRAQDNLKKALAMDPKFTRGWLQLAVIYIGLAANSDAIATFQKAIDSDPSSATCRRLLAFALMGLNRLDESIKAWQELLKVAPGDPDATTNLGTLLFAQKRYSEALPYLETAVETDSSSAAQFRLGSAYLQAGQTEKAVPILEKVALVDPRPEILNDVAYQLADAKLSLPETLELAQRAVDEQERESYRVQLTNLLTDDVKCTQKLGVFWDTLGWVHFRLGHFVQAESYLSAAWVLTQMSVVADHLGQVYEQEGKKANAIQMYRLALTAPKPETQRVPDNLSETRQRLAHLTSGTKEPISANLVHSDPNNINFSLNRLVKLPRFIPGRGTAEFFMLFAPGPKLEDVKFISGSDNLKNARKVLESAKFPVAFPAGSSARLLRRAIVMCVAVTGCQAILYAPDAVHSVK
jgi:tetratricopeptide (TPR) repeat protein